MQRKPKIAIACQGGGSQTAFTAGALSGLLRRGVQEDVEIVSLSGASGGAICAALVWAALRRGEARPWERLEAFWAENLSQSCTEHALNGGTLGLLRVMARGQWPVFNTSPYAPGFQAGLIALGLLTRPEYADLGLLLSRHLDLPMPATGGTPALVIGAVDILTGRMDEFTSLEDGLRVEHLLASAAVPGLFPAVEVPGREGSAYWDGLFSDNPPIGELLRPELVGETNIPDEIWVIKINPTARRTAPTAPDTIADRRNELYGNVSLFHQLACIGKTNDLYLEGAFDPGFLARWHLRLPIRIPQSFRDPRTRKPYHIPCIEMSEHLQQALDYESKLDRSPRQARRLMEDGARRADAFLKERAALNHPCA